MAVNEFKFNLDIEKEDYIPKFKVKQYDTAIFYVNLFKNGTPFPTTNETIKIFAKKSDGTMIYQEDEISIENGLIKINVKNQAFTSSGVTYAELELKSSTGQVTTATFIYEVREKVGSDKAVESITDISTLEKVDKYVEEAKKELDKFKNTLSPLEDLVANQGKLEGQNTEAKVNIKELEKVLEDANNIVSDEGKKVTGNNVVSESTNGYVQDIKLSGRTLVNLFDKNTIYQSNRYNILSDGFIQSKGDFGYGDFISTNISMLEPNQDYILVIESRNNKTDGVIGYLSTDSRIVLKTKQGSNQSLFQAGENGIKVVELKTLPNFGNLQWGFYINANNIKGTVELRCTLIKKTTNHIPNYFEGLKSVGDAVDSIEINSCNGNLFDIYDFYNFFRSQDKSVSLISNDGFECIEIDSSIYNIPYRAIKFKPNTQYIFEGSGKSINGQQSNSFQIKYTDGTIDHVITAWESTWTETKITSAMDKTIDYIMIGYWNVGKALYKIDSFKVYEANKPQPQTYKSDTKKLLYYDPIAKSWKKPILREWDTIEQHLNGKYYYHKRSKVIVVDGNETWAENGADPPGAKIFYTRVSDLQGDGNIICDRLPTMPAGVTNPVTSVGSAERYNALYLTINNNDGSTPKEYLRNHNLEVVLKVKEEVYECLDISVRSFRDTTMLSVDGGSIDPGVEYYLPSSFVSADNSICEKVDSIDAKVSDIYEDIDTTQLSPLLSTDSSNVIEVGKGLIHTDSGYVTKDYRGSMERSLVTLGDVLGETQVRHSKLWNINLCNIASYDPRTEIDIFSQPVFNNISTIYSVRNGILAVQSADTSFGNVQYAMPVKPNTTYMLSFDVEEITGNSWVAISSTGDYVAETVLDDITYMEGTTSSIFTTGDYTTIYIRFYANVLISEANKLVNYSNAKLVEAKDYIDEEELIFRGLPNSVRDTLKNGNKMTRIATHNLNGTEDWKMIGSDTHTNVFYCKLPYSIDTPDKTEVCLNVNKYPAVSDSELSKSDREGVTCFSMGGDKGQLVFRLGKWCTGEDVLKNHLANNETDIVVEYEIQQREEQLPARNGARDLTLLCDTGDKILLGSPIPPVEITHKVQLNTRSQIEVIQDSITRSRKGIWSRLKDLIDAEYIVEGYIGYLKLPTLLGGFIIQWGYEEMGTSQYNYLNKDYPLPIKFPNVCYYTGIGYMRSGNSWQDLSGNAVGVGDKGRDMIRLHIRNTTGNNLIDNVSASWIAIGR